MSCVDDEIFLRALHPEDFRNFRRLRLKSLAENKGHFCSNLEQSTAYPDSHWQIKLNGEGKQVFGLFAGERLIGLSGIFTWREDPTGQTGVLAMSYIEPAYRCHHYSTWFYEARLWFAAAHLPWNRLTVSHRAGNEASRRAIVRHGFLLDSTRQTLWSDGSQDTEIRYMMDLDALRVRQTN